MGKFLGSIFYLLFFVLIVVCIFAKSSQPVGASGNLIGWWKFDEASGNASDSSGSGLTLTNNNVTYTTGEVNGAASFNGTNAGFTGTGPNLANSSFSISAWIYANTLGADQTWFDVGSSSTADKSLHLRLTATGGLHMGFFLDDLDTASGIFSTGTWHQVIYTYNSSNRARAIYLDGVQKASGTAGANFSGDTVMTIGSWGIFEHWNGNIDDVKVYNRVLTGAEITDLAGGGSGPDVPTPTPTMTPTPTVTPPSVNNTSSAAPSCGSSAPINAPKLFQIAVNNTSAIVYFVPVNGANSGYYISYGLTSDASGFGTQFNYSNTSGVVPYTINSLFPGTWYFKVRGQNGCMPGNWSGVMSVKIGGGLVTANKVLGATTVVATKVGACTNYTVQSGDSLWRIASSHLGNGMQFNSIMQKNNLPSTLLRAGQVLKVGC